MENEENGITLSQLLKVMIGRNKKRKILLGCITLAIFIIMALALKIVYNGSKEVYTANFDWTAVGLNEGKYVDGSNFDYLTLQTTDVLNDVKNSNERFNSIDVNALVNRGAFSIKKVEEKDKENNVLSTSYRITTLQKYYPTNVIAREFVEAVGNYPIKKTIEKLETVNYDSNIVAYNSSIIFDAQVDYLKAQYSLLNKEYKALIETYGDVTLNNNKSVSKVQQELLTYFTNYSLDSLTNEISNYGYVKDYNEYRTNLISNLNTAYITYVDNLVEQKDLIQKRNELVSAASGTGVQDLQLESFNKKITEITTTNTKLVANMRVILRKLARDTATYKDEEALETAFPDVAKIFSGSDTITGAFANVYSDLEYAASADVFASKMDTKYKDKLVEFTNDYKETSKEVVTNYSAVSWTNGSVIVGDGGLNTLIILVLSLVVGLVCGMFVNLCLDSSHLHDDQIKHNDNKTLNE